MVLQIFTLTFLATNRKNRAEFSFFMNARFMPINTMFHFCFNLQI